MNHSITVLGSTGSIGTSTLDVIARHPGRFSVFALTASTQVDLMLAQCATFKPRFAVMASASHAQELEHRLASSGLPTRALSGSESIDWVASHADVDFVMAAIVGAAGLSSALAAAKAGKRLLLANKEALVVGGGIFLQAVKAGKARLLPIDSEHSAVFQSLPQDPSSWDARVEKIILTASGGPFRRRNPASFVRITPEEACAHPNWSMGRKISVDSATMMNKALEVIEAHYLFGMPPPRLNVVIHPQSIIHSMVQYRDTSVVAQLGTPDMRVPIAYGLAWPERMVSGAKALDFHNLKDMTFESIDDHGHPQRFPCLFLAWSTLKAQEGSCAVLNAANEVAVEAFLARRIRFDQIHNVNVSTLDRLSFNSPASLDDLMALDREARDMARQSVQSITR